VRGSLRVLAEEDTSGAVTESLKEAASGGAPMSPEVARRVVALFREFRPPDRVDYNLTPHELRLLKLLVEVTITKQRRQRSA